MKFNWIILDDVLEDDLSQEERERLLESYEKVKDSLDGRLFEKHTTFIMSDIFRIKTGGHRNE